MNKSYLIFLVLLISYPIFAQTNAKYVNTSQIVFSKPQISMSIIRLMINEDSMKVKYFSGKEKGQESVYNQFSKWAEKKNIIFYSSGSYISDLSSDYALPVGFCINQGKTINNNLILDKLHGLIVINQLGKISVHNLKNSFIELKNSKGEKVKFDLSNSLQKNQFFNWAKIEKLTAFQTHLFLYENKNLIANELESDQARRSRRLLASGTDESGNNIHYMINIPTFSTIREATNSATNYLKDYEEITSIHFIINLDSGSGDTFGLYKSKNLLDTRNIFQGTIPLSNTPNLLVYYVD